MSYSRLYDRFAELARFLHPRSRCALPVQLALACASVAVSSVDGAAIWEVPGWSLHSSVSGRVGYDSNIFGREGGDGDTTITAQPNLWLQRDGALTKLRVDASATVKRFMEYSDEDSVDPRVTVSYGYPVSDTELPKHEAELTWYRRTDADPDVADRFRQTTLDGGWNGELYDTGKTTLDSSVGAGRWKTDAFNATNENWRAGLGVGFRRHELQKYSLSYTYSVQQFDSRVNNDDDSERDEHQIAFGVRGELLPKVTGRVSLGVARGSVSGGIESEKTDWTAGVSLEWAATELRRFSVRMGRGTNFASDGNLVVVTTLEMGVAQEIAGGFTLNLRGNVRDVSRESGTFSDYGGYGFGAGLRYNFTGRLAVDVGGEVSRSNSDTARFDFSRHAVHMGATYNF